MDPNANLAELRRLLASRDDGTADEQITKLERIAELTEALDEWITRNGALPRDWAAAGNGVRAERATSKF